MLGWKESEGGRRVGVVVFSLFVCFLCLGVGVGFGCFLGLVVCWVGEGEQDGGRVRI